MRIFAGQADGFAAVLVDEIDDFLVYLPAEHHFYDFHRLGVGNAHALHEFAFLADLGEQGFDLRSAAVHYHHVQADALQ